MKTFKESTKTIEGFKIISKQFRFLTSKSVQQINLSLSISLVFFFLISLSISLTHTFYCS